MWMHMWREGMLAVFPIVKVADHTTEMHDPYYRITLSEGHVTSTSYSIPRPVCATFQCLFVR